MRRSCATEFCARITASRTLSRTDRPRNSWLRWKVRVSPRFQMRCGGSPVISRPSMRKRPLVGCVWPAITLNSVVLPAPFGPIMARRSPGGDAKADILQRLEAVERFREAGDRDASYGAFPPRIDGAQQQPVDPFAGLVISTMKSSPSARLQYCV